MNELIIWVLILIVCIILYVINHFYVFRKTCSVKLCDSDIRYKKCSPILGTGNGLGISLYGGARYDSKTRSEVYYQFVTIIVLTNYMYGKNVLNLDTVDYYAVKQLISE